MSDDFEALLRLGLGLTVAAVTLVLPHVLFAYWQIAGIAAGVTLPILWLLVVSPRGFVPSNIAACQFLSCLMWLVVAVAAVVRRAF